MDERERGEREPLDQEEIKKQASKVFKILVRIEGSLLETDLRSEIQEAVRGVRAIKKLLNKKKRQQDERNFCKSRGKKF